MTTPGLRPGLVVPRDGPHAYVVLDQIGSGANGTVYRCRHMASKDIVAIKHIPWSNLQKEGRRALREIMILKHVRHPHLICCLDVFQIPARGHLDTGDDHAFDVCLVMPYVPRTICDPNYREVDYRGDDEHANEVTLTTHLYYLLRGLDYYHKCGLSHRDLSARNVLINKRTHQHKDIELYIADFGMSRDQGMDTTFYVTTRPYRAPEILSSQKNYTHAIDIWAVGCIIAQALMGRNLFNIPSSRDPMSLQRTSQRVGIQVDTVLHIVGTPSAAEVQEYDVATREFLMNPAVQFLPSKLADTIRQNTIVLIRPDTLDHLIDAVVRCCAFGPAHRPSAHDLLRNLPLFRKHNLVLPDQVGKSCPLPDVSVRNVPEMDDVLAMIKAQCGSGNRYSPFTMIATTPRALDYVAMLKHWESDAYCQEVCSKLHAEIHSIDKAMDSSDGCERVVLEETALELLDIHTRLARFTGYNAMAEELVTQGTWVGVEDPALAPAFGFDDEEEQEMF